MTTIAKTDPSRIEVSAQIPQDLTDGLAKGLYERFGGAIRVAASKQIVAWLREAIESSAPLSADMLALAANPGTAAALNLALTGMGFAVVMKRLDTIQGQLRQLQQVLETIDYKIDLSFYANFRAALDLAANSFTLANAEARRVSSLQAINRFLEAEHHYTELADRELGNASQVADDYLVTLCLAYVTEAWCYLELGELETAQRRLQEGQRVVRPRFERHTRTLTSNPAAYLHPSVQPSIDLARLTGVFRWLTPGVTENAVFDAQRQNLFTLAREPQGWIDSLPQAIRLPVKSRVFGRRAFADLTRHLNPREMTRGLAGLVGAFTPAMKAAATWAQNVADDHEDGQSIFARLPESFATIESMIEHCSRFEAYLDEVRTMRELGIGFDQWQRLAFPGAPQGNAPRLMCIKIAPRMH